jgi:hypothetical protein
MSIAQSPRYNTDFFSAQYKSNRFVFEAPYDLSLDEMLKPSFWSHVANQLHQWDVIQIHPQGAAYKAELVVVEAGHLFAKVAVYRMVKLEVKEDDAKTLDIEQIGNKFRVRRGPDVMKDNLATKKDAERWIEDYAGRKAA